MLFMHGPKVLRVVAGVFLIECFLLASLSIGMEKQGRWASREPGSLAGVNMELAGPVDSPYPYLASEWRLEVHNNSASEIPFSEEALGRNGQGGGFVMVQVRRVPEAATADPDVPVPLDPGSAVTGAGDRWRSFAGNPYIPQFAHGGGVPGLGVGESSAVLLVVQGQMRSRPAKAASGDKKGLKFDPVFGEPGEFEVRAVLIRGDSIVRSNVVRVLVVAPPVSAEGASTELEELISKGLCIGVDGHLENLLQSDRDHIDSFIRTHPGTRYGEQLAIGAAKRLMSLGAMWASNSSNVRSLGKAASAYAEARVLLASVGAGDAGLKRTMASLRARNARATADIAVRLKLALGED